MFTSQVFPVIEITETERRAAAIRFNFKMLRQGCKKLTKPLC